MTTRTTTFAAGTPCWVDLMTSNFDQTTAFYTALFGWTLQQGPAEFGGYSNFLSDGHLIGGVMPRSPEMPPGPDVWSTYIATDDIEATTAAATAAGATVIAPPMAVGDMGHMAVFVDPAGGFFGLWQGGTHTGFGKYNEPGSVTWDEYHSKNFAASRDFYAGVFGWTWEITGDSDDFRYFVGEVDGSGVAGMMDSVSFLPAEVPSHWAVYFAVADADAAQAKAVELGATVVQSAEDTPYGRIANLLDPTGANFRLLQDLNS